eukprot:gene7226-333_t
MADAEVKDTPLVNIARDCRSIQFLNDETEEPDTVDEPEEEAPAESAPDAEEAADEEEEEEEGGEEKGDEDDYEDDLEAESPSATMKGKKAEEESKAEVQSKEEEERKEGDESKEEKLEDAEEAPPSPPSPPPPPPPAEKKAPKPAAPKAAAAAKPSPKAKAAPLEKAPSPTRASPVKPNPKDPFTFSSLPNTVMAKPHSRNDFSHNRFDVMKMNEDNQKLCKRLLEISGQKHTNDYSNNLSVAAHVGQKLPPANIANSSVTRRKKEDKIAAENLALYKRLQGIKPSRELNRNGLNKDFQAAQGYGANARKFRPAFNYEANGGMPPPESPPPASPPRRVPAPAPAPSPPPRKAPAPAPSPPPRRAPAPAPPPPPRKEEPAPPPPHAKPKATGPKAPLQPKPKDHVGPQPIVLQEASNPAEDDDHRNHEEAEDDVQAEMRTIETGHLQLKPRVSIGIAIANSADSANSSHQPIAIDMPGGVASVARKRSRGAPGCLRTLYRKKTARSQVAWLEEDTLQGSTQALLSHHPGHMPSCPIFAAPQC